MDGLGGKHEPPDKLFGFHRWTFRSARAASEAFTAAVAVLPGAMTGGEMLAAQAAAIRANPDATPEQRTWARFA